MPIPILPPPQAAKKYMEYTIDEDLRGFNSSVKFPTLKLIRVDSVDGKGIVVCRFRSERHLDNNYGMVHGGAYGVMIDIFASFCMWLHSPLEKGSSWSETGVTQNLQIIYLHSIPIGAWVEIENSVLSVGKNLAVIQTNIYLIDDPDGGRIKKAASGTVTKVDSMMIKHKL